jgi:hypothetical protein
LITPLVSFNSSSNHQHCSNVNNKLETKFENKKSIKNKSIIIDIDNKFHDAVNGLV